MYKRGMFYIQVMSTQNQYFHRSAGNRFRTSKTSFPLSVLLVEIAASISICSSTLLLKIIQKFTGLFKKLDAMRRSARRRNTTLASGVPTPKNTSASGVHDLPAKIAAFIEQTISLHYKLRLEFTAYLP